MKFKDVLLESWTPPKGIGKKTQEAYYVHKDYESVFPSEELESSKSKLPDNFKYTIVKRNKLTGEYSFIKSPDWDKSPEPIVGDAIKVGADKITMTKQKADPQIYHHKFEFVGPDYKGFDYEESKQRSAKWKALPNAKDKAQLSRIGTKSYWEKHFVPLIK